MPSTKSASFLSGVTSGIGSTVRRGAEAVVRARRSLSTLRSQARLNKSQAGLDALLKKHNLGKSLRPIPEAVPTTKPRPVDFGKAPRTGYVPPPATTKPLVGKVGKGLLLVGGAAALYGAGKAATTRAQRPLAPPEQIPPGY